MPAWYDALPGPAARALVDAVLEQWPQHASFFERSFKERDPRELEITEQLAQLVLRLYPNDRALLARGYRWMCEMVLEEELEFKRNDRYRYSSFQEVNELVYQQSERMAEYMHGLLLSAVAWHNHTRSITYFADRFLAANPVGYQHLEVGPGHGLLLYLAASDSRCKTVTGLDISSASLEQTQAALSRLGVEKPARCLACDIARPIDLAERFDSVVISEVCEHLEAPQTALLHLRGIMAPGGRIFVNMPINAPAIDHIYLLRTPEEVVELVRSAGFEIESSLNAPSSGYSEARARKLGASISVCVIGRVPRAC
jgi:2-polyprenyl-3-methyl-5-hydroxy-6-metoxy-1,4-benzoquinol methylase